jgi:predicted lipoprotein with Yx(FWY)xxD motif
MRKIWLFLGVALLGAILALGAVACGDDDDDDNGGTTPDAPTATEAADATEAPGATEPDATEAANGDPSAFTTVVATDNPTLGTILTTFDGYTLYTFDSDTGGTPTCLDACANTWPPMVSQGDPTGGDGVSGTLDLVERPDGIMQVTYDGTPLYMYSGDPSPGDTNGDGFGGVWHVVSLD